MRMNVNSYLTAKDVVNNYSEENLSNLFFSYGELRNSKKISSAIADARKSSEITTTSELVYVVENLVPEKLEINSCQKFFSQLESKLMMRCPL
jgi:16S rRNA (cytosine1402-N4)-methyltransferase